MTQGQMSSVRRPLGHFGQFLWQILWPWSAYQLLLWPLLLLPIRSVRRCAATCGGNCCMTIIINNCLITGAVLSVETLNLDWPGLLRLALTTTQWLTTSQCNRIVHYSDELSNTSNDALSNLYCLPLASRLSFLEGCVKKVGYRLLPD